MTIDLKHLDAVSWTQLSMAMRCGQQWIFRYVQNIILPPDLGLARGQTTHEVAATNFRQKKVTGIDLKASLLEEMAVANWEKRIRTEGLSLTQEEEQRGKRVVVAEAKDEIPKYARALHQSAGFFVRPATVEEPLAITVQLPKLPKEEKGRLVAVEGKVDLTAYGHGTGALPESCLGIIDHKSTTRRKGRSFAADDDQLTLYLIMQMMHGKFPDLAYEDIPLVMNVLTPKGPQILGTRRGPQDVNGLLSRMGATILSMQTGYLMPASRGHWGCDPRYCGWWRICPHVGNGGSF